MLIAFDGRPSDSPYIEQVWRSRCDQGGRFISIAEGRLELVVSRLPGVVSASFRGPETRATDLTCPRGEWFAVRFRPGVYLPAHPTSELMNLHDLFLPTESDGSFVIGEHRCRELGFETAEDFVHRLARAGFLLRDDTVAAIVDGGGGLPTQRSAQRHFRRATGLTPGEFGRIERARYAANMLRSGAPILDTVHETGYFDQAHMTRSLRAFIGLTPAAVARADTQLSFLYKTTS